MLILIGLRYEGFYFPAFPLCLLVVFFFLCRFVNKQNIIKRINTEKILCLCDGSDIYSALFFSLSVTQKMFKGKK